jgi:hypothetical protein
MQTSHHACQRSLYWFCRAPPLPRTSCHTPRSRMSARHRRSCGSEFCSRDVDVVQQVATLRSQSFADAPPSDNWRLCSSSSSFTVTSNIAELQRPALDDMQHASRQGIDIWQCTVLALPFMYCEIIQCICGAIDSLRSWQQQCDEVRILPVSSCHHSTCIHQASAAPTWPESQCSHCWQPDPKHSALGLAHSNNMPITHHSASKVHREAGCRFHRGIDVCISCLRCYPLAQ